MIVKLIFEKSISEDKLVQIYESICDSLQIDSRMLGRKGNQFKEYDMGLDKKLDPDKAYRFLKLLESKIQNFLKTSYKQLGQAQIIGETKIVYLFGEFDHLKQIFVNRESGAIAA